MVNVLTLEDYVNGVICYEMGPTWPLEALKAQAEAAACIPGDHHIADIVHTTADSLRAQGRCLGIFHSVQHHTAADRELCPQSFYGLSIRKSHPCTSLIIFSASFLLLVHFFSAPSKMCIGK